MSTSPSAQNEFLDKSSESELRLAGSFFSNLKDIWQRKDVGIQVFDLDCYNRICRKSVHGALIYKEIHDANYAMEMADEKRRSQSTTSSETARKTDMFGNRVAVETAHNIPHSPECSRAYGFLAEALSGQFFQDDDAAQKRLKLVTGVRTKAAGPRQKNTGMKNHPINKFNLLSEKYYFDSHPPLVLLVPVLTLQEALEWTVSDYPVLAIPCGDDQDDNRECQRKLLLDADALTGEEGRVAVEKGRGLLESVLKGMVASLRFHSVEESVVEADHKPLQQWRQFVQKLQSTQVQKMPLPAMKEDINWNTVRVAVGTLTVEKGICDPLSLAARSASAFVAVITGDVLMPACPSAADSADDDEDDEAYWKWVANRSRSLSAVSSSLLHPNRRTVELFSEDAADDCPEA